MKISVCILAVNEERKIEHALKSARACSWCDELIVWDSGSTDRTVEIAKQYADKVEFHPWVSFSVNRKQLTDSARHDWVFILDADEEISEELAREIGALSDEQFAAHPVMTMPRKNYLMGRYVRCWDPDRIARLCDRTRTRWPERSVHDDRIPTEGTRLALGKAVLHNRHADDFEDYFEGMRYAKRSDLLAREMFEAGRRAGFLNMVFRPLLAFLKFYVVKGGFWDGTFGLMVAQKAALATQLKYARLWHLQQQGKRRQSDKGKVRRTTTAEEEPSS